MEGFLKFFKAPEVGYILLIFFLFIVPKLLQRFRLPSAITSFALGIAAGMWLHHFQQDATISLLATLGIVSLFLHAGLDVNVSELRRNSRILIQHLALLLALLVVGSFAVSAIFGLSLRVSILVTLSLATPSTGFILDSIKVFGLSDDEKNWIKTKAISAELLALAGMFLALQSLTVEKFLISLGVMLALALLIPLFFRFFASKVVPYAPNSEFAFLIMLAVACAFVTRKIGVYYLVGAFVVGVAARRFEQQLPSVVSDRLIHSVELFASFFVPFYFFNSGTLLTAKDFSPAAWLLAAAFLIVMVPARLATVVVPRYFALKESIRKGLRVAFPMLPTLIFTLVIAQILREQFAISSTLYGSLVIYAVLTSIITGFVFRTPLPDFEHDMLQDALSQDESVSEKRRN
jgi:Kef-type K+ transport system membrane component KefB